MNEEDLKNKTKPEDCYTGEKKFKIHPPYKQFLFPFHP